MSKKYIYLLILFAYVFPQDMPGQPDITWIPIEYDLIDGNINLVISWDMWWGENGDHWILNENSNNIYESSLIPNSFLKIIASAS